MVIVVSCSNQEYSDNYEHKAKNKNLEKHIVCQEKKSMRSCGQESSNCQLKRNKGHQKETSYFAFGTIEKDRHLRNWPQSTHHKFKGVEF